jgi:hypothetical protein
MFFLAGLQRIEYVFAYPDLGDLVLAGPAEGWTVSDSGAVVGSVSGRSVLRLDDLMESMQTVDAARSVGLSCSIEPTQQGLERYARLISTRRLEFNREAIESIRQAMGPQQILIAGASDDGHFARVMVGADYLMKRLAMGLEPSRVKDLPSYLEILRRRRGQMHNSSPRWWMAANYDPLLKSPDGLAWQIRGPGVKTLTEDSFLDASGRRTTTVQANPAAVEWADRMTERFDELSVAYSSFSHLRNCFDMAVVAALISDRDLLYAANCELSVLTDSTQLRGPRYETPKSVDSNVSFIQGNAGWIVSVSGGVDINAWPVLEQGDCTLSA